MPPGTAEEFRERTRSGELTCVVPDCLEPRLSAVNRGNRRHGFSHQAGAGSHSGMGLDHLQSQLLVADWLRLKYPGYNIELEETTQDNRRRADVMLTSPSGRKAAFEVQYAPIAPAKWQERHDSYRNLGIVDVWLWGHTLPQLRRERGSDEVVELKPTHEAVARAGLPLLWINPELGQIGTITQTRSIPGGHTDLDMPARVDRGMFLAESLDAYRLDVDTGLTSDRLRRLLANEKLYLERLETERLEAERIAAEAEAAQVRRTANMRGFVERVSEKATRRAQQWLVSADRNLIFGLFNSRWPKFLGIAAQGVYEHRGQPIYLPFPDEMWQTALYLKFMHAQPDRSTVTITACAEYLATLDPDVRLSKEAVTFWFHRMVDLGAMEKVRVPRRDGTTGNRYVIRDPKAVAAEREFAKQVQRDRAQARKRETEKRRLPRGDGKWATTPGQLDDSPQVERLKSLYEGLIPVPELRAAGYEIPELLPPLRGKTGATVASG